MFNMNEIKCMKLIWYCSKLGTEESEKIYQYFLHRWPCRPKLKMLMN